MRSGLPLATIFPDRVSRRIVSSHSLTIRANSVTVSLRGSSKWRTLRSSGDEIELAWFISYWPFIILLHLFDILYSPFDGRDIDIKRAICPDKSNHWNFLYIPQNYIPNSRRFVIYASGKIYFIVRHKGVMNQMRRQWWCNGWLAPPGRNVAPGR